MPEWEEGDRACFTKTITDEDVRSFARITGDTNPLHLDEEYAQATRFGRRIAHGILSAGLISTVIGTKLPGPGVIYMGQTLRFTAPVYLGDTITATATIISYNKDRGRMTLSTICTNQDGEEVITGEAQILYRR